MFEGLMTERMTGRRLPVEHGTDRPLACKIITKPATFNQEVYVIVPALGENAQRGPCRWDPIAHLPEPLKPEGGEDAIVQFDTDGTPWIIKWWPYA